MTGWVFIHRNLIKAGEKHALFLTLILFLTLMPCRSYADNLPPVQTAQDDADKLRAAEATRYVRKQLVGGMTILPNEVRNVAGWFSGSWHTMNSPFGDDDDPAPVVHALADPEQAPAEQPMVLSSNFHHKGFLPTHDSLMIGPTFGKNILDGKVQLISHTYAGQSWHSLNSNWGSEIGLTIAQHEDGLPWGQISVGYVGGSDYLNDRGNGIDMHGDVDLTNGFKFTSGLRQDNIAGDSNYMMVKWKMDFQ